LVAYDASAAFVTDESAAAPASVSVSRRGPSIPNKSVNERVVSAMARYAPTF
jgi:hypothetical protein